MSYELRMPRLTELMASAKIVKWLKKEGELIKEGEPLFLAESEKAVEEVPSPITGVLKKIVAQAGSEVNPDDLIAIIEPSEGKPEKVEEVRKEVKIERIKISPRARRLAEQYGIDITKIKGTGPGGRIVERDIMRVVEQMRAKIEVPEIKKIPLNRVRRVIAERLTYGYREAIPSGIVMEVDATELVKFKEGISEEIERKFGVKITYTDIFVKAVGLALEKHPILNSSFKEDHIEVFKDVNVGIAVATEEGVLVPVIKKVNEKSLIEVAKERERLVDKARKGELTLEEMSGGTFTITNVGMFNVDVVIPVINPPQSAILGIGKIVKKPVVVGDNIEIKQMITLSLVFDHRTVDGAQAAEFLNTLSEILQRPYKVLL